MKRMMTAVLFALSLGAAAVASAATEKLRKTVLR